MTEGNPGIRIGLDDIAADYSAQKPRPDALSQKEAQFLEHAAKREHIKGLQQDNQQRKLYANRVFGLLCGWVGGLFAVILLQGFATNMFRLSDNVLLALIGGTTVNIIGIFLVVVRYLFPKR